jgi:hypothetical protein
MLNLMMELAVISSHLPDTRIKQFAKWIGQML